jgi:cytochrome c oxidase subunit 2
MKLILINKWNFCLVVLLVITNDIVNAAEETYIVELTAERYRFSPQRVKLPANRKVELHVVSVDVLHGFQVPALGIRFDLQPGNRTIVMLPALAPGEYPFLCDVFCGSGHNDMNGYIEVGTVD